MGAAGAGPVSGRSRVLNEATAVTRARMGGRSIEAAHALNGLAVCCKYLARFDEATPLYRRALAIARRHRDIELMASVHHNLGGLAHAAGRAAEGERSARETVRLRTQILVAAIQWSPPTWRRWPACSISRAN